jgi:hypothetical protein
MMMICELLVISEHNCDIDDLLIVDQLSCMHVLIASPYLLTAKISKRVVYLIN